MMCEPSGASAGMVMSRVKPPAPSANRPPSPWSGVSRYRPIASPGLNPLPVTVTLEPAGPDASLRLTLPWLVGVGTGVAEGDGAGDGDCEGDGELVSSGAGAAASTANGDEESTACGVRAAATAATPTRASATAN